MSVAAAGLAALSTAAGASGETTGSINEFSIGISAGSGPAGSGPGAGCETAAATLRAVRTGT